MGLCRCGLVLRGGLALGALLRFALRFALDLTLRLALWLFLLWGRGLGLLLGFGLWLDLYLGLGLYLGFGLGLLLGLGLFLLGDLGLGLRGRLGLGLGLFLRLWLRGRLDRALDVEARTTVLGDDRVDMGDLPGLLLGGFLGRTWLLSTLLGRGGARELGEDGL